MTNLNNKAKPKWILVVVVKCRHRAIVLLQSDKHFFCDVCLLCLMTKKLSWMLHSGSWMLQCVISDVKNVNSLCLLSFPQKHWHERLGLYVLLIIVTEVMLYYIKYLILLTYFCVCVFRHLWTVILQNLQNHRTRTTGNVLGGKHVMCSSLYAHFLLLTVDNIYNFCKVPIGKLCKWAVF